ncbi:MAG: hypothetical protein JMN26_18575 [gamma proteobacterium endosymbiont of Lamellibrachia anaximandri]|nr:hypothetical protein [gamma proteobacterium endosymbiont of Lamellibrachia anaximandri]
MMPRVIPNYRNRSAESIVSEKIQFESSGYIYRALSWLDFAKRKGVPVAFQYAAHDARQGIEQLLFEELVLSVGTNLDRTEYEKCLGNSTKLYKIINRLAPQRENLAKFTRAVFSVGEVRIPLVVWDHKKLMQYWGRISNYLHWAGAIDETIQNESWVKEGILITEEACAHIWNNLTQHEMGVMLPNDMHPEIRDLWERYKAGKIGLDEVRISSKLLDPALK